MKTVLILLASIALISCTSTPKHSSGSTYQYKNLRSVKEALMHLKKNTPKNNRKLIVFMDGTGNTQASNTNIYKLYQLSLAHAQTTGNILPYYITGVGTDHWYTKIVGGAFGDGIGKKIQEGYRFLAENYHEGDEIFLFGFSRGAYSARSLNGLIEFAGLIDRNKVKPHRLKKEVQAIFDSYHTLNDGTPNFEIKLRALLTHGFNDKIYRNKVVVTSIGVFDTVAALGLVRDDFPDNHRTNLYAKEGYHALSLDEQRDDFRLLRFDDYNLNSKTLKEVWFPGVHADVGGGYDDSDELDSISRLWMLDQFKKHNLFANELNPTKCSQQQNCYMGKLHDAFFDSKLFGKFGISRRKPRLQDSVHQSVICRMKVPTLPQPHPKREVFKMARSPKVVSRYKPFNLSLPVNTSYFIENEDTYTCEQTLTVQ